MLISIAIPCYRSAKTLPSVVAGIDEVFKDNPKYDYELILVNDGSPDNTFEVIYNICRENEKVTGINLSKNFGQSAAKAAAIPYVSGEILVYMDDDGQHPAEGIIPLAEKVLEGNDIVYARFKHKKHSLFKRATSRINQWLLVRTGSKPNDVTLSPFCAFSSFSIKAMKESDSPTVAMGAYLRRLTNRVCNVDVSHHERITGKSNYSIGRMFGKWVSVTTSFNTVSLRVATYAGVLCGSSGIVCAIIIVIRKLLNPSMPAGYASTMVIILVLCGVIMFLIGILGEYIGKMYLVLCKLPPYKVRNVVKKDEQ